MLLKRSPKFERGYLDGLSSILNFGATVRPEECRTGVGSRVHHTGTFILDGDEFPLFLSRKVNPRLAFEEFWFMLKGKTQTKELEEKGVNFWKGNTSREFLDNRGLHHLEEGDMGKAYGYQWRNSGGVDQLKYLLHELEHNPYSRRLLVDLWNPSELDEMALTPCWWSCQFSVTRNSEGFSTLHMVVNNRSLDLLVGMPYAVTQYRMFQMVLADIFGFKLGQAVFNTTNIHVYETQYEYVDKLLKSSEGESYLYDSLGSIVYTGGWDGGTPLDSLLNVKWEDFEVKLDIAPKTNEQIGCSMPRMVA